MKGKLVIRIMEVFHEAKNRKLAKNQERLDLENEKNINSVPSVSLYTPPHCCEMQPPHNPVTYLIHFPPP